MKTIDDFSFAGQVVLIRVDFNVPLQADFSVADGTRILATVPTIAKIRNDGGRVVLMSHLGRPSAREDKYSLRHIVTYLEKALQTRVSFVNDCLGEGAQRAIAQMKDAEVILLENVRFYAEEEAGDVAFAQKLAKLGDMYVNDAFGTAHRAHASTAIIAQFFPKKACFGYVMANEILNVNKVLKGGTPPITAVVGGSKVSSKIAILEQLMGRVDHLIIGGGMAYTFLRAQGGQTGNSICEESLQGLALELMATARAKGVQIHLPIDVVCADAFSPEANTQVCEANAIPEGWQGLDAGPKTIASFAAVVKLSKTLLWNGPIGVFEFEKFATGTRELGEVIAAQTEAGTLFSLVGGGDSVSAVNQFGLAKRVSYVSTGGGAMLEYLEGRTLPGIEAVLKNA